VRYLSLDWVEVVAVVADDGDLPRLLALAPDLGALDAAFADVRPATEYR
jgi:hypothetical protein